MGMFLKIFQTMKMFLLSMFLVILIAIGLSYLPTTSLGENNFYLFILAHPWIFIIVRVLIIISFILAWPLFVKAWAKKLKWNDDVTHLMVQRRWRFAIWLILIDVLFELI